MKHAGRGAMMAIIKATGRGLHGTAGLLVPLMVLMAVLATVFLLAGCSADDCLNCVDIPPPVVPTGVHSISGDGYVIVQWNDLVYAPYDRSYNENLVAYEIYRRRFEFGDENDPDRTFDPEPIATISWDNENYDARTGLRWYEDDQVSNGLQYEYAVVSVNAAGARSALSYEFVVDAPLPMSPWDPQVGFVPVAIFDANAFGAAGYGFVFSRAAAAPTLLAYGRVTPGAEVAKADIEIFFSGGVPFVTRGGSHVQLQDFGDYSDDVGNVLFEGVTWAPINGYSVTGTMELVPGHVYVVRIATGDGAVHFAKFGVDSVGSSLVNIIWAYQLIANLPELSAPVGGLKPVTDGPQLISL
jgi:hypothetical protein